RHPFQRRRFAVAPLDLFEGEARGKGGARPPSRLDAGRRNGFGRAGPDRAPQPEKLHQLRHVVLSLPPGAPGWRGTKACHPRGSTSHLTCRAARLVLAWRRRPAAAVTDPEGEPAMSDAVKLERHGAVAVLRLDDPSAMNALSPAVKA